MKILIAGWFSFKYCHATAGDLLAAELAGSWLFDNNCPFDYAVAPPFFGGVDWRLTNPKTYTHVVFVCGPFDDKKESKEFLAHFLGCKIFGLNLSMIQPLSKWNPFDVLIERDSSEKVRPDIVFLTKQKLVPLVGICLVEPYGADFEEGAYEAIQRLVSSRDMAIVNIDTRLDKNETGLRSSAEIETLIARMDLVVTTRLHGTVLSLKNGVPTISIEPGGDNYKIEKQIKKIGWPLFFTAANISDFKLSEAFDYCLTEEAKKKAKECSGRAKQMALGIRNEFLMALDLQNQLINNDINIEFKPNKYKRIYTDLNSKINWGELPSSAVIEKYKPSQNKIRKQSKIILLQKLRKSIKEIASRIKWKND